MTFEEVDERYPYTPGAKADYLRDLEKLRAIDDPRLRRLLFDLWKNTGGGK